MSTAKRDQSPVSTDEFQSIAKQVRETLKGLANTLNALGGPATSINDILIVEDQLYHRHTDNRVIAIDPVQVRATHTAAEFIDDKEQRKTAIMIREAEETHFTGALASALVKLSGESSLSKQITAEFGKLSQNQFANDEMVAICKEIAAALLTIEYMNSKYGSQHPSDALTFGSHLMIRRQREAWKRRVHAAVKVTTYPGYLRFIELVANGVANNADMLELLDLIPETVQEESHRLSELINLPAIARIGEVEALNTDQVKDVFNAALGAAFAYAILVVYKDPQMFLKNPAIIKDPAPNRQFYIDIAKANI